MAFQDYDRSGKLHPDEFSYPEKMSPALIRGLGETRLWVKRPLYATRLTNGTLLHPHGDAVPPEAPSHASFSLHQWGIDHALSKMTNSIVADDRALGLAQDCDFNTADPEDLYDLYHALARMNLWTGVGVYPFWNRPGFHLDLRPHRHPSHRSHWLRDERGAYRPMSWKTYKEHVLYRS